MTKRHDRTKERPTPGAIRAAIDFYSPGRADVEDAEDEDLERLMQREGIIAPDKPAKPYSPETIDAPEDQWPQDPRLHIDFKTGQTIVQPCPGQTMDNKTSTTYRQNVDDSLERKESPLDLSPMPDTGKLVSAHLHRLGRMDEHPDLRSALDSHGQTALAPGHLAPKPRK